MEELKKALERSEDSIGLVAFHAYLYHDTSQCLKPTLFNVSYIYFRSLQSKLEVLEAEKNEKKDDCKNGLESPVSHIPSKKLQRVESSTKETSKDELSTKETSKDDLSAGSFTHETRINWSPESQVPAASADDNETKPEVSQSTEQIKVSNVDNLANFLYEGQMRTCRKPRGKRKRKDCSRNIKEAASIGESDLLDSADVLSWCKESSTSNCGEVAKSSDDVGNRNKNSRKRDAEDMIEILDSIFETKGASAFRRRLDSQVCVIRVSSCTFVVSFRVFYLRSFRCYEEWIFIFTYSG